MEFSPKNTVFKYADKKILASILSEKLDFKVQILAQGSNFENSYLRNERSYRVEIFIEINYEKRSNI
jgi:hypothetical protein